MLGRLGVHQDQVDGVGEDVIEHHRRHRHLFPARVVKPDPMVAGVRVVQLQLDLARLRPRRRLDHLDRRPAGALRVSSQSLGVAGIRLDRHHLSGRPDGLGQEQRHVADVAAHVDGRHPGPQHFSQDLAQLQPA